MPLAEISIPITTLLTSLLALWLVLLSAMVIKGRRSMQVSLGDGGDEMLQRRVRAQANLTEYAPIFLIMLGASELQGGNTVVLSIIALIFLAGRIAHGYAFAFTAKSMKLRVRGMILTFTGIVAIALYNLGLLLT